jgi:hypothetical protein
MMQAKLQGGYQPNEAIDGRNLWRVRTGDRVVWIESGDAHNGDLSQTLVALNSNALVFGERHVHPDDLAWFLSFGAVLEPPDKAMVALLHAGLEDVERLGLPRHPTVLRDTSCASKKPGWR